MGATAVKLEAAIGRPVGVRLPMNSTCDRSDRRSGHPPGHCLSHHYDCQIRDGDHQASLTLSIQGRNEAERKVRLVLTLNPKAFAG